MCAPHARGTAVYARPKLFGNNIEEQQGLRFSPTIQRRQFLSKSVLCKNVYKTRVRALTVCSFLITASRCRREQLLFCRDAVIQVLNDVAI